MDYYKLLDFYTEPFSNSPDPEFFFGSSTHLDCLQKLEISIRLRRGLCVVLGQVGAGKTTLCRKLIYDLQNDPEIDTCLILDPSFMGSLEMLGHLNRVMRRPSRDERPPSTEAGYKELLKNHLFEQVVREKRNVVLIVDEAQKISSSCLEVLRELLNFETNEHKLLQIVMFGQNEFKDVLRAHPNFTDRVNLFCKVSPLTLEETGRLINFRLKKASDYGSRRRPRLRFTARSVKMVYALTNGHPRRIMNLCHRVVMLAIIRNRYRITPSMVKKARQGLPEAGQGWFRRNLPWLAGGAAAGLLLALSGLFLVPAVSEFKPFELLTRKDDQQAKQGYAVRMHLDPVSEVEAGGLLVNGQKDAGAQEPDPAAASGDSAQAGAPPADRPGQAGDRQNPSRVPEEFGRIRVSRHENLWNMVERVYGRATEELMDQVAGANPHIRNIHNLYEGLAVYFPVNGTRSPARDESCWIVLDTYPDLGRAYTSLLETDSKRLRILAFSENGQDVQYAAAWRRSFASEEKALKGMDDLPGGMKQTARLVTLDDDHVLLY